MVPTRQSWLTFCLQEVGCCGADSGKQRHPVGLYRREELGSTHVFLETGTGCLQSIPSRWPGQRPAGRDQVHGCAPRSVFERLILKHACCDCLLADGHCVWLDSPCWSRVQSSHHGRGSKPEALYLPLDIVVSCLQRMSVFSGVGSLSRGWS